MTLARVMSNAGDSILKRMSLTGATLSSQSGTAIPLSVFNAAEVQSAPAAEFASFAARYQLYRVRSLRVSGRAINPVQTATLTHSTLHMGDFMQAAQPTSDAQVFSDERSKSVPTHKSFVYEVNWDRNPNAKLWTPTSAAIPTLNNFSFVASSPAAPPLLTATVYYAVDLEWLVEFKGSQ